MNMIAELVRLTKTPLRATPLSISKRQKQRITPSSGLSATFSPLSGGEGTSTKLQKPRRQIVNGVAHSGHGRMAIVLTCEHGGNNIPAAYRALFSGAEDVLQSHRGWDPGALRVARSMARILGVELFFSSTSRLLVELNRSLGHRSLFSDFTANLPDAEKQQVLARYWQPYRDQVTARIEELVLEGNRVFHLSVHSFTPVWEGSLRRTNIGLLYDPKHRSEKLFCSAWKAALRQAQSDYTIHSNQPYRGISDGFTTALRRRFRSDRFGKGSYNGIEVEINQSLIYPATQRQILGIAALLSRHLIDCQNSRTVIT